MQLTRHNHVTRIERAPAWFYDYLSRHLSIPIEFGTKKGARFGITWKYAGQLYGSLVRGQSVAAGLTPHVEALAKYYQLPCHTYDAREKPGDAIPWHSPMHAPRPYQKRVHQRIVHNHTGVIDAPPRSGKTLMVARAIDALALPSVVVAPSVQIVRQTYERFCEIFGHEYVSRLDGDATPAQKDPERLIVVATANSVVKMPPEWWDARDVLIIDEFHHAAAETYHAINTLAQNVYYRYGFTGTHFRTGDDTLAMEAICSFVLEKIELRELVPDYLAPPHVFFVPVRSAGVSAMDWLTAYRKGIVECEERNALVALFARTMLESGIPTIVLTRHRAHADELGSRIADAVVVKGGENALTSAAVRDFVSGRVHCLVGTTVIGEGVDVPRAGALIYASGGNDGVQMAQAYYRPLTAFKGKAKGRIYDFQDTHHGTLSRHSDRRVAMARELFGSGRVTLGR